MTSLGRILLPLETREKNKYARSIEVMKSPVHVSESAMAFAFQSGQNHWSTLQIVDEKTLRTWTPDEQLLVKQVADQLSLALENARLFQETQLRATELSVLNEMGNELSGNLGASAIAEVVYKYTSQLIHQELLHSLVRREQTGEVLPDSI